MKNVIKFLPIAIFVVAVIALGVAIFSTSEQGGPAKAENNDTAIEDIDHQWFKGPEDAKVTITEYSDFQCPYCKVGAEMLREVEKAYEGKIKIVFRHFPLLSIHQNALPAALAAEAAGYQGKFWEMHDMLFANQNDLSYKNILSYAETLELDMEKFKLYYGNTHIEEKVRQQIAEGQNKGVQATPTLFINGQKIEGIPYLYSEEKKIDDIAKIIDEELGKS